MVDGGNVAIGFPGKWGSTRKLAEFNKFVDDY